MTVHEKYMLRCLQLARLGKGHTGSNPLVGSVLVYKDMIIGEGYHEKYGEAHAEVNCLKSVKDTNKQFIPEATLYVNLEPCNHTGKTPPCSQAIVKADIKKVVVGTEDLNPLVESKGIQHLKNNNVQVVVGVCQQACYKLNKVFFTNHKEKRAFVKLKWAETADGYIGETEKNIAISNRYTNIVSHKYRAAIDGILVGYRTALNDKPALNARHWLGLQPARIFLDWNCELPTEILQKEGQRNIVFNSLKTEMRDGIQYVEVAKSAKAISVKLLELDIQSILVEGGAQTHELFMKENIWDEAIIIRGEGKLGKGIVAASLNKGHLIKEDKIDVDTVLHYSNSFFIK